MFMPLACFATGQNNEDNNNYEKVITGKLSAKATAAIAAVTKTALQDTSQPRLYFGRHQPLRGNARHTMADTDMPLNVETRQPRCE